jgi:hypothetical protein
VVISDFVVACRDKSKISFACDTLSRLQGQANVDYGVNYMLIYMYVEAYWVDVVLDQDT